MATRLGWVAGLGLGAGVMYILDPDRGRRRRAVARDKFVRQLHRTSNGVDIAARDLAHRTQGVAARARGRVFRRSIDDSVLVARVRSKLGRLVSHPHAVEVLAHEGRITLRGLALTDEASALLSGIEMVPGVKSIENQLKVYKREDQVPALQGGRRREEGRFELMQENWSPSARFLVAAGAALPIISGLRRRNFVGYVSSGVGLGFLVRALSNQDIKRFFGIGPEGMITVHKVIQIDAPVDDVFRFWTEFDNFSQFLPEVIEVHDIGQNRSRWTVAGPGGLPVRWTAVTTRYEPNSLIAWRSEPGAIVRNSGRIRFVSIPDGGTRVEADFSYQPPAGRLGHAVAKLFGSDPKSQLDDALIRVKSLFERGPSRRHWRRLPGEIA